ncbi:hypothetical protein CVT25_008288 [Psilocybe cyanescens]|uniref:Uncharacterized protein n=1 Tax=Psilocybe cyanescens TaxID=93625 RepID=A0A409XMY6_PSICY|nr:hypothetical protein CVT25_008288 [Psilocybe cyanescens]
MDGGASFSLITHLLGHIGPPNLDTIKVSSNETHSSDTFEAARRSLELYPFDVLDKHFSCHSFKNLHNVVIFFSVWINSDYEPSTFNAYAYKGKYHSYVTSKLPLCMERDPAFSISVPIVIKMTYGDGTIEL